VKCYVLHTKQCAQLLIRSLALVFSYCWKIIYFMHWFKKTLNPLGAVNRSCKQTSLRVERLSAEQLCCLQIILS